MTLQPKEIEIKIVIDTYEWAFPDDKEGIDSVLDEALKDVISTVKRNLFMDINDSSVHVESV